MEAKGFPHVCYNPQSKQLEYLDIKRGRRDVLSRAQSQHVEGEFDADEEMLKTACNVVRAQGFEEVIPEHAKRQGGGTARNATTSGAATVAASVETQVILLFKSIF